MVPAATSTACCSIGERNREILTWEEFWCSPAGLGVGESDVSLDRPGHDAAGLLLRFTTSELPTSRAPAPPAGVDAVERRRRSS